MEKVTKKELGVGDSVGFITGLSTRSTGVVVRSSEKNLWVRSDKGGHVFMKNRSWFYAA
jgi:hypothetical protein